MSKSCYVCTLLVALLASLASAYLHHPETPVPLNLWGFKYSDILHGVFATRFSPSLSRSEVESKWYDVNKYYGLVGGAKTLVVPYIDYKFEYPPIVGLLWTASTNLAIFLALPENYTRLVYAEAFYEVMEIHYAFHAVANGLTLIATSALTAKLLLKRGICGRRCLLYLLPSTIIYAVYNWDLICALFALLGLNYYLEGRPFRAGAFLGLSISTKILTLFAALAVFFLQAKVERRAAVAYLVGLIAAAGLPFSALAALSPRGLVDFVHHHATWYCENCIYQLLDPDIFSARHKLAAAIAITALALLILYLIARCYLTDPLEASLTLIIAAISLNYVFSPQMMLLITPLAILALDRRDLAIYAVADALNSLIIVLFFEDLSLRRALRSFGFPVRVEFNPWHITSVVQWVGVSRIALLLVVLIRRLLSAIKRRSSIV